MAENTNGVNASDEAAKLIEQRKRLGWSDERIGAELAYRGLPTPGVKEGGNV